MNNSPEKTKNPLFIKENKLGEIEFKHFDLEKDLKIIYKWTSLPYAQFWGLNNKSISQVKKAYSQLINKKGYEVILGYVNDVPSFLVEKYVVLDDDLSSYYSAKTGDYGMHILIAPPDVLGTITDFSWHIFSTVMSYFFHLKEVQRVIVEPDINNHKIHALNRRAGFEYQNKIKLPEKTAHLAFCTPLQYKEALTKEFNKAREPNSDSSYLKEKNWANANLELIKKGISEFSHELIFTPTPTENKTDTAWQSYRLITDDEKTHYHFKARKTHLDHWLIDGKSIKRIHDEQLTRLNGLTFILDFKDTLNIPIDLLPTYLEEISSTLCGSAYKLENNTLKVEALAKASFQVIEQAMSEGHPCFIANNGRIGFNNSDYHKYAPEKGKPFNIIWLAAHKNKCSFSSIKNLPYNELIHKELGGAKIIEFEQRLRDLYLKPSDYLFLPVHPWQWNNKIIHIYATDISLNQLVFMGNGDDLFLPQQSIRTLFNASHPSKYYIKTALSILNMGFMRGLSPYYMESTPAITQWITDLFEQDNYLNNQGFKMLGEVATIGYKNTYFEKLGKTNAYNKMLSALWRESPIPLLKEKEHLMTMASFLHKDTDGKALVVALIEQSGITAHEWVSRYLNAYLNPLIHCFYTYEIVFMPHGENIIMLMENNSPKSILMKDITEEVVVMSDGLKLEGEAKRLYAPIADDIKLLSIFTDVFDCFFRFLAPLLNDIDNYNETLFWKQVASSILDYQKEHPKLKEKFQRYDLFSEKFQRSCLNRLQLNNNKQMIDLQDPSKNLQFFGYLKNPIAPYKHI